MAGWERGLEKAGAYQRTLAPFEVVSQSGGDYELLFSVRMMHSKIPTIERSRSAQP